MKTSRRMWYYTKWDGLVKAMGVNWNRARLEARKIIERFDIGVPPVDVVEIVRSYGLSIRFVDFPEEDQEVSGLIDISNKQILVNVKDSPVRQNFTIAHELGHYILHKKKLDEDAGLGIYFRTDEQNIKDTYEKEANAFAAELLMPTELIKEFKDIGDVIQLARLFGVSAIAMEYKLGSKY